MAELFEVLETQTREAVIKVIGVGGGGSNTVNQMVTAGIRGVEFICANTDAQHLRRCEADVKLPIGQEMTRGLGAGADPNVGRQAAMEDRERILEMIDGTDMLFITAGMGGGTGTGAAPVIAEIAREMGILTVAVVTKPFQFERSKRMQIAKLGIEELNKHVHSLIVIPNERLLPVLGNGVSMREAFKASNDVLHNAVQGIAEIITCEGLVNVDFADVKKVMGVQGMAMIGIGTGRGEDRAREAAESALSCPLLEELTIQGAEGLLVNVTAKDLTIDEFTAVNELISETASESAEVIIGNVEDDSLGDELRVTVVATGLDSHLKKAQQENKGVVTPIGARSVAASDYEGFDKPVTQRAPQPQKAAAMTGNAALDVDRDMDYLDVPAFLRAQAD